MGLRELAAIPHLTVETTQHADAILDTKFVAQVQELTAVLSNFRMGREEIIAGGGGETSMTQRLRRALSAMSWEKKVVKEQYFVDGVEFPAESHEVDHLRDSDSGRIALEIEWNNKDPFFDRDLENFRKLHQIGFISVGAIITRGPSLQANLYNIFVDYYSAFSNIDDIRCTAPQRSAIKKLLQAGNSIGEAAGRVLYQSKYGAATTHWDKLMVRVHNRGLGKPCPLLLLGLESSVIDENT